MEAVTGHVEFQTDSIAELIQFVSSQIERLEGKRLEISKTNGSRYVAEAFSSVEPVATV